MMVNLSRGIMTIGYLMFALVNACLLSCVVTKILDMGVLIRLMTT